MTSTRCVHGLDSRFCSICNRRSAVGAPRASIGAVSLPEIVEFLNHAQIRATYRAVGDVIGVSPIAMSRTLGPHTVEASWIVSAATGLPAEYGKHEMHPSLLRTDEIIDSGAALIMRITAWKATRQGSS